jgi:NAD(P)-dependent dehydrogenase (short-subunit alcohol dehydrogenase family)
MVNNAAISGPRFFGLLDTDFDEFDRVMRVNLLGVMAGTQHAARHMATAGGGAVINLSSIAALQPTGGLMMYAASKAAVINFTKCAAIDLGQHAVRVNCIAPAHVVTPILAKLLDDLPEGERETTLKNIRAGMRSRQPLRRQGTASDVAAAALYFASDRSAFVTGTVLSVDGGAAPALRSLARRAAERLRDAAGCWLRRRSKRGLPPRRIGSGEIVLPNGQDDR